MDYSNIDTGWSNYSGIVKRLKIGQSASKLLTEKKVHRLSFMEYK